MKVKSMKIMYQNSHAFFAHQNRLSNEFKKPKYDFFYALKWSTYDIMHKLLKNYNIK